MCKLSKSIERKCRFVVARGWDQGNFRGNGKCLLLGLRILLGEDEDILELDSDDDT